MSRGFVKEGDQEEVPMVTPRAYLPAGVENFVTPEGLQELKEEREALIEERQQYENVDNNDARIHKNYLSAKLQQLEERMGKLHKLADKVDKAHKEHTISNGAAHTAGAVPGARTRLGLALAPVTGGSLAFSPLG